MKIYRPILAIGVIFLFLALAMVPATSQLKRDVRGLEAGIVNRFFEKIEHIASECRTDTEFTARVIDLAQMREFSGFPIIQKIITKILEWIMRDRSGLLDIGSGKLSDLLGNADGGLLTQRPSEFFVISRGTYKRYRPNKDNTIFKQGFAFMHYRGGSKFLKDRTMIISRKPFDVKQRVVGTHFVVLMGFRGLLLDMQSKLTGNSYRFVMGRAFRARAIDLNPFSD
jgi:hypothetical protein